MTIDTGLLAGLIGIGTLLIPGLLTVIGIVLTNRNSRQNTQTTTQATTAIEQLKLWETRLKSVEDHNKELQGNLETLRSQLEQFRDKWRIVTDAVSRLFWQIDEQWPENAPGPHLDAAALAALDENKAGITVPPRFRIPPKE